MNIESLRQFQLSTSHVYNNTLRRFAFHFLDLLVPNLRMFLVYLKRYVIRPRVKSYGDISTVTLSPGKIRM